MKRLISVIMVAALMLTACAFAEQANRKGKLTVTPPSYYSCTEEGSYIYCTGICDQVGVSCLNLTACGLGYLQEIYLPEQVLCIVATLVGADSDDIEVLSLESGIPAVAFVSDNMNQALLLDGSDVYLVLYVNRLKAGYGYDTLVNTILPEWITIEK